MNRFGKKLFSGELRTQRKVLSLAIAGVLVAGMSQQGAAASLLMEEILVTAQKREQNVQDVGISVTAFNGEQLKELGYTNSIDVAQQTPGLNIIQFHPALTNMNIRGISQNDFADHLEGPVALVIDDVYVGSMGAGHAQLFDTARVEVLRGPQGTLFGRNATGGLVHFVSETPTEEFEGYVSATIGDFGTRQFKGAISGTLADNFQARLAVATDKNDGLLENRIGPDLRDTDARAARLMLAWQPSDDLDLLLKLHTARDDAGGNGFQHDATFQNAMGLGDRFPDDVDFNGFGLGPGTDFNGYADFDGDAFAGEYDENGFFKRDIEGATLKVTYALSDGLTLTSVSDYLSMDKDYREDTDSSPFPFFHFQTGQDYAQYSQELRINSETDTVRWQVGAFYLNMDSDTTAIFDLDLFTFGQGTDFGQFVNTGGHQTDLESESWAVFGQTDFDVSDALTVTLGVRYTDDERDMDYNGFDDIAGFGVFTTTNRDDLASYDDFSFKAQLDWRPSDATLVYAGVTRGHKAGNFRLGIGAPNLSPEHDQEELLSYEIGIKTELFDGAMRLNATAFYYDYSDYQAFVVDPTSGTVATIDIINVDATAQGLEIEITANPADGLDLLLGATLMDSEVENVTLPDGVTTVNRDLPYAPRNSLNGLARYQWAMANGVASVQVDFNYSDDFCFSVFCGPLEKEESYTVANARVKYEFPGEKWSVTAFVKNFTDEEYRLYALDVAGLGLANDTFAAQRQYGLTMDYSF